MGGVVRYGCPVGDCPWYHDIADPPAPDTVMTVKDAGKWTPDDVSQARPVAEARVALRYQPVTRELLDALPVEVSRVIMTHVADHTVFDWLDAITRERQHRAKIDDVLRSAGIEHPTGANGVRDLVAQRDGYLDAMSELRDKIDELEQFITDARQATLEVADSSARGRFHFCYVRDGAPVTCDCAIGRDHDADVRPAYPLAEAAPPRCDCTEAGRWGATGRMPDGHFWYVRDTGGGYLAHTTADRGAAADGLRARMDVPPPPAPPDGV